MAKITTITGKNKKKYTLVEFKDDTRITVFWGKTTALPKMKGVYESLKLAFDAIDKEK